MATVQLNHTVAQIMPSPTATALLIEANQTSPWTPSTISAIIIGSATVALGIPGAIAAFYAFRKHRRRNGRHQSTDASTDPEHAAGFQLEERPLEQAVIRSTVGSFERLSRTAENIELDNQPDNHNEAQRMNRTGTK